jgi:hypothetical protein
MSFSSITIHSVDVPYFIGNDFMSWKFQMSTYLCKMNYQVWWMVDVGFSHALNDCPQTQAQKNVYISKLMHLMVYLVP